jgi:hypothetical protein
MTLNSCGNLRKSAESAFYDPALRQEPNMILNSCGNLRKSAESAFYDPRSQV